MRLILALVAALLLTLSGCSTSTHIMIGNVRSATSPADVKLYLDPPAKYEAIALVGASGKPSWAFTSQQQMDVAMQRLKEEAAGLGANGILFGGMEDRYNGSLGSSVVAARGYSVFAVGASTPFFIKEAKGVAIYVEQEITSSTGSAAAGVTRDAMPAVATPSTKNTVGAQSLPETVSQTQQGPPSVPRVVGASFGPSTIGLGVLGVEKGGVAAHAGLRPGDVITHINGRNVVALYWENAAALLTTDASVTVRLIGNAERVLVFPQ